MSSVCRFVYNDGGTTGFAGGALPLRKYNKSAFARCSPVVSQMPCPFPNGGNTCHCGSGGLLPIVNFIGITQGCNGAVKIGRVGYPAAGYLLMTCYQVSKYLVGLFFRQLFYVR
jgi:hypothetical protein